MRKFTIEMNYNASIIFDVEAEDEGQALDKARNLAEEADISDFTLTHENESRVINQM
ncbi:MAG: hypothetical protein IKT40_12335 [Bacilli bacterium]|nr:hypothetical protein [Bacilli bacterium]